MNTDVEFHIRQNYPWNKLPANVKQVTSFNVSSGQGESGDAAVFWVGGGAEPVNVTAVLCVIQAELSVPHDSLPSSAEVSPSNRSHN